MQKDLLNYTEYELGADFAFGQTKAPLTNLKRLFLQNLFREDVSGPR